jgi:hypothetical protein
MNRKTKQNYNEVLKKRIIVSTEIKEIELIDVVNQDCKVFDCCF